MNLKLIQLDPVGGELNSAILEFVPSLDDGTEYGVTRSRFFFIVDDKLIGKFTIWKNDKGDLTINFRNQKD